MDSVEGAISRWEGFKEEIYELYIVQNKSLDEVRSVIKSRHKFEASKSQYESQLRRRWGFRKYLKVAQPEDLKTIGRAFIAAKVKAQGSNSTGSESLMAIQLANLARPVTARTLRRRGALSALIENHPSVYDPVKSGPIKTPTKILFQTPLETQPKTSVDAEPITLPHGAQDFPNFAEFLLRASVVAETVDNLRLPFKFQHNDLALAASSGDAIRFLDAACPRITVQALRQMTDGTGVLEKAVPKLRKDLVHACILRNNFEMALYLADAGMNVNAITSATDTGLNAAIRIQQRGLIAQLSARGAIPFFRGRECECGSHSYANALVAAAEVDYQACINTFPTSMHHDINSFGTLSQSYGLVRSRFCRCATPLTAAILAGHTGLVRVLISKGAMPDSPVRPAREGDGSPHPISPLAASVLANNFTAATYLLDSGADPVDHDAITATSELKASGLQFIQLFALCLRRRRLSDTRAWSLLLDSALQHFPQAGAKTALEEHKTVLALILHSNCAVINGREEFKGNPPAPLYTVLLHGFFDLLPILAGAGADYNSPLWYKSGEGAKQSVQSTSVLRMAVENVCGLDNERILWWIEFLLDAGAGDLKNAAEIMSISLVELSVRNRAAPITELLLSKDKPLSPSPFPGSNKTALQYALDQGDLQTAELLLRYGADPNGSLSGNGKDLRTPLQIAVQKQRLDIIELLLRNGANLNKKPHVSMPTPLQMAAELGVVDILTNLLRHGANVDDKLEPSWLRYDDSEPTNVVFLSPLQIAVCSNHTRIIKTLLEFGADANGRSMTTDLTNPKILLLEARHTPLQLAVNKGYWETVRMLLNHNADVNASAHPLGGATALQYAARRGFVQAAQFLLLKGANIDAPPAIKDGRTALEGAAENGELEMVRLLLDCGANIYGLDFHRAGLRAESNGHEDVRSLLKAASEQRIAEYWARRNAG